MGVYSLLREGHIELGSVTAGNVGIQAHAQGFEVNYPNENSFGDIQLTQRALASASGIAGVTAGSVQIQGKQVSIGDGSMVLVQNRGSQAAGDITVNATEILKVSGASPDFQRHSSLINETLAAGTAGNIALSTPQLIIDRGGFVLNRTFSAANGGNIIANVTGLTVGGSASGDPLKIPGFLFATSNGSGNGGQVSISTQTLSMLNGATVGTRAYADGNGGNVVIKADAIRVSGAPAGPSNLEPTLSLLVASTFGNGNGGDIAIDTRTLLLKDSGIVSTSSVSFLSPARGDSGNITIRASESIEVNGETVQGNPSLIGASGLALFSISGTGNAGNVTISTPVLNLNNSGRVIVSNVGTGNAGTLNIVANSVKLDNGGRLLASTNAGEGGNINLQIGDRLLMRHGSSISTTAGGNGNGGNITLNSPIIVGLENSDIIANAFQGNGGRINITTQGLFGLKYRNQITSENDITASSEFGINGTVDINNFGVDPNSGLVKLPENITDASQQIATGCSNNTGSSFVATGRGGVPQNPSQEVTSDRTWDDLRDLSAYRKTGEVTTQIPPSSEVLVAATTWHRNVQGKVELIAAQSPTHRQPQLTCAAVPKS
jgi:large exoprotein involved in heme utilization and adhesion